MITIFLYFMFLCESLFSMAFRTGISLNYQRDDVPFVKILTRKESIRHVVIEEPEKIQAIKDYINSLEIIEVRKVPANRFGSDVENYGWISIYFGETRDHNPGDIIEFMSEYMGVSYNMRDWEGKNYFVKNSGFCSETKTSNIYYFLRDLIDEG